MAEIRQKSLCWIYFILFAVYCHGDKTNENGMGEKCITHSRDDKYVQSISRKVWKEETIWKTNKYLREGHAVA
jgi:hypothetical protein